MKTPPWVLVLALRVALCPAHIVALVEVITGVGFTVTVAVALGAVQPAVVV